MDQRNRSVNSENDIVRRSAQIPSGLINDEESDDGRSIKSETVVFRKSKKKTSKKALSEISSSLAKMKNHLVNPVVSAKKLKDKICKTVNGV